MEKTTISRNQIINQLMHMPHGELSMYVPICMQALANESELFGHLISYNNKKGEVRDSKAAFPIIALRGEADDELYENAVANLCTLDPRTLVKGIEFHKKLSKTHPLGKVGAGKILKSGMSQYVKWRERNDGIWIRTALQHRKALKSLYTYFHIKPSQLAQDVLFDKIKPKGSVFEALANLKNMNPQEAAGTILNFNIPFLIASGAVGGIKGKPDIIMALIEKMSGSELINNTDMLRRMGVLENPVLKSAYDSAITRAKDDKKVSTMKAGKAAEKLGGDTKAASIMKDLHESKLETLGGIEGDWLVLGDKSGSMQTAIQKAREVSSLIAQQVKGNVELIFFDTHPTRYNVTGKSLDEITKMTSRISAQGGTSCGCGIELAMANNILVSGIAICSDGGDNTNPTFEIAYKKYVTKMGIEPTVYLFWVKGEEDVMSQRCAKQGIQVQKFDVNKVDYYSLPNLIKTMRTNKFSLVDEIMSYPLLTFKDVFKEKN